MQSLTKKTLGIFWRHSKRYPWQVLVLIVGVLGQTALQIYKPLLYRDLIDALATAGLKDGFDVGIRLVVLIFVVNFASTTIRRVINFTVNYFQPRVMADLTNSCYQYLHKHSFGFFSSNFVGSLVMKVKRYERAFEQIADQLTYDLGRSLLVGGMILGVMLWQYRTLGYIVLAWCVLFFVFSYFFSLFKLPYDIKRAAADTKTTAQLADTITNNTNIKLFTNYEAENKRFGDVVHDQYRLRKKSWDLGTWGDAAQAFSMIVLELVVMYLALISWRDGRLTIGDIALLQSYLGLIFDQLWNTGRNIRNIYEALADANEMTEMITLPHAVTDAPGAPALAVKRGEIVFKDVHFGYHQESAILSGFHLKIVPGERVAFIGPSGGGKSTIVKLLFRLYDVKGGEILVDGQNIAGVTQDSLRQALSLVPQDPILFHRSLMENIRYAKPSATDEEVIRAATLANAHDFIMSFTQKYETFVGERGIKLSGGERQRVAIARAILKDAPILVLDEATSSLDSESEMLIQDALKKLMQSRTTIVIAHRLSTIMQMDRIVVVENGKIIEEGKHEELLKVQQGVYQKLWGIQAGGFAAA